MDEENVGASENSSNAWRKQRLKMSKKILAKCASRVPYCKRKRISVGGSSYPSFLFRSHVAVTGYRRKIKDLLKNNCELAKSLENSRQENTRLEHDLSLAQRQVNFKSALLSKLVKVSGNLNHVASLIADTVATIMDAKRLMSFSEDNSCMDTALIADNSRLFSDSSSFRKLDEVPQHVPKRDMMSSGTRPRVQKDLWQSNQQRVLDMSTIAEVSVIMDDIRSNFPGPLVENATDLVKATNSFDEVFSSELERVSGGRPIEYQQQHSTPENKEPEPSDETPKTPVLSSQKFFPSLIPKPYTQNPAPSRQVSNFEEQTTCPMDIDFVSENAEELGEKQNKVSLCNVTSKRGSSKSKRSLRAKLAVDVEKNQKNKDVDISAEPFISGIKPPDNFKRLQNCHKNVVANDKIDKTFAISQKDDSCVILRENLFSVNSPEVLEYPVNRKTFVVSTQPQHSELGLNSNLDLLTCKNASQSLGTCQPRRKSRRHTFIVEKNSNVVTTDTNEINACNLLSSEIGATHDKFSDGITSIINKRKSSNLKPMSNKTEACPVSPAEAIMKSSFTKDRNDSPKGNLDLKNNSFNLPSAAADDMESEPVKTLSDDKDGKHSHNTTILGSTDMELTEVLRLLPVGGLPQLDFLLSKDHIPASGSITPLLTANGVNNIDRFDFGAEITNEEVFKNADHLLNENFQEHADVCLTMENTNTTKQTLKDCVNPSVLPSPEKRVRSIVKRLYMEDLNTKESSPPAEVKPSKKLKPEKISKKGVTKSKTVKKKTGEKTDEAKNKTNSVKRKIDPKTVKPLNEACSKEGIAFTSIGFQNEKIDVYDILDDSLPKVTPYRPKKTEELLKSNNCNNGSTENTIQTKKDSSELALPDCPETCDVENSRGNKKITNSKEKPLFEVNDADLNPAVQMDKGKYAASDANKLKKTSAKTIKTNKKERNTKSKATAASSGSKDGAALDRESLKFGDCEKENKRADSDDFSDFCYDNKKQKKSREKKLQPSKDPLKCRNSDENKHVNVRTKSSSSQAFSIDIGTVGNVSPVVALENLLSPLKDAMGSNYLSNSFQLKSNNVLQIVSPAHLDKPVEIKLPDTNEKLSVNVTPSKRSTSSRRQSSLSTASKRYSSSSDQGSERRRRKQAVSYRELPLNSKLRRPC